ncbi:hypothetical protein C0992_007167 [Termitomyces sp. T32_za158]|nr:hypothetical protein C0992_007167 [Termitomyces sp. T32_za158]
MAEPTLVIYLSGHKCHKLRTHSIKKLYNFMFLANLGFTTARLCAAAPRLTRSVVNRAASWPVPPPRGSLTQALKTPKTDTITTPAKFLQAIGRSSETKLEVEQWDALWKLSGHDLRQKGLAVRDRRYVEFAFLK